MPLDTKAKRWVAMGLPFPTAPPLPDAEGIGKEDRAALAGVYLPSGVGALSLSLSLGLSPAAILATYIIEGLERMSWPSDNEDWPLYISHMPDGKNVKTICGAIYDTTGISHGRYMSGTSIERPGVQLHLRSRNYETLYIKMENIAYYLDYVRNASIVIDDTTYTLQNISRTSPIINLGWEAEPTRRVHLVLNFLLTLRKES